MTSNDKHYICPLLKNPELYNPDTIDLCNNVKARNYWLPCLEQMVKKFVNKAGYLNPDDPNATEKAEICFQKFHSLIEQLMDDPTILKPLSMRDSFNSFEGKWLELTNGVLAGNVFDWGAKAVTDILERTHHFGLAEAMMTIQKRPWFHDDLDSWIKRLKKQPYRMCIIFVDNCGVDFILGILPMVREFLRQGTKVVLTANSTPSLNDVTYRELNLYCYKAALYCPVLKESLAQGQLITVENGQRGPCLDLSHLSPKLCDVMKCADLVIIEGMGRAVHTNLYAKFAVDCLKLAVLKNEWLANSLGAEQFSVICDFESAT
ncbi:hypothetical protein NQ318_009639 [Aromia moschata]|uniref:4'-phosphopantetheine phosphatase n=1 Tax=Aromia moschata TaxID=1265417 RepID=A0AAV8Y7H4_9CUCU|nr:hypothetical protein NQ318_009639 [Aromia moschata]